MRNMILAGAAALAFTATPALPTITWKARPSAGPPNRKQPMTAGPPIARQLTMAGLPRFSHYWTLTPSQMQGWWVLTDEQRVRIYEMTPDARTQAWTQIAAQMSSATPTAPTRSDASPRFQSKEMVQATPAEYTAASGDNLPVAPPCSRMDASAGPRTRRATACWNGQARQRNPRKASGDQAGHVSELRALGAYWPTAWKGAGPCKRSRPFTLRA